MILIIKFILIITLAIIFLQDFKERSVWWFLFPLFIAGSGIIHFHKSLPPIMFLEVMQNLIFLILIMGLVFLYSRYKLKKDFLKDCFGIGDILFLIGLAIGFPTISFLILLSSTCIFSISIDLFLRQDEHPNSIPMAGYSSLLMIVIYISNWFGAYDKLYF